MTKTIYRCPMDPDIVRSSPGKCPKCGMELIISGNQESNSGHMDKGKHTEHNHHEGMEETFKNRFFLSIPIVIAIILLSPNIQEWLHIYLNLPFSNIVLFILTTVMVFYMAVPFYQMAAGEIRSRNYGMMTLVSLAVLSGYFFSFGATFIFAGESLYWEVATLVLAFLFGHWIEMRAVRGATGALSELAKLTPNIAHKLENKKIKDVGTQSLVPGDFILIRPGEKIPIDGIVIKGESSVNEAMITGESDPVLKKTGVEVIGGTVNTDGSLTIRVTKTGKDTVIFQMMKLVEDAQATKPSVQRFADRAAGYLTFIALSAGILTFIFWAFFSTNGLVFAGTTAIAVIVIACPHALGLAIPTVTVITASIAAKKGILIRDMRAFETVQKLTYVIFDKTGTLTEGALGVSKIVALEKKSQEEVLRLAGAVEYHSQHPVALGIIKEAKKRKINVLEGQNFKSFPGKGAIAYLSGKKVLVGNRLLLSENGIKSTKIKISKVPGTEVWVAYENKLIGVIILEDTIRAESKKAIEVLHNLGIKTAILTGDTQEAAENVAKKLSVDTVYAQVLPQDKVSKVRSLQEEGNIVAMVGDGVNDAAALSIANVGIAIGAGTGVAIESAQIILMKNDVMDVVRAIKLSKATGSKMFQNLLWAAGYNILAIPAAAGVFYNFGVMMRPEWGALLMSASSVIVVFNALLLRRVRL